jgi:TIR domain
MKHIFISHAGEDAQIANRLAGDLKNAGHDTKVDTKDLHLGDDAIDYMNQVIADAHTVVILFSKHTPNANWQKLEINAAVWNEVAQEGGVCVVVRLDATAVPPVLGKKVWGTLVLSDLNSYRKLVEDICTAIIPRKSASSIVSEAFGAAAVNPFRRVRAEYFEDRPDLLAATFAPLDPLKTGALEEMKPCFVEGSRGTGKSMLLLSLRARNFLSRQSQGVDRYKIFGFYLKLSRGAICNAGVQSKPDTDPPMLSDRELVQITEIAAQEVIACLIESLLSELSFCIKSKVLTADHFVESAFCVAVFQTLFGKSTSCPTSVEQLQAILAEKHLRIAEFIRRRFIYGEELSVPVATLDLESLKLVLKHLRTFIPSLASSMFVALLDEYENLFPYQKRVVNGLVKLAAPDLSVKIANKLGSGDTSGTTTGQDLQETHDYTRLVLVYDMEDSTQLRAYHELLQRIVHNILLSEGVRDVGIADLLPEDASDEVEQGRLIQEIAKLWRVPVDVLEKWPHDERATKVGYYREAAAYRVLYGGKGRHRNKRFSGFKDLAFLSSGIIRYFQEFLGVAYHLAYGANASHQGSIRLPPGTQSQAVYLVSEHNLTTLSRNVEAEGEALKYFLLDLGDCLRHKLLRHTSEPEAARLTIEDPQRLAESEMDPLRRLLTVGAREGVFQTKEGRPAFKPKHSSDPQPCEFNICRVFAPVLQISPRLRWRTAVRCATLLALADPARRTHALQELKSEIVKVGKKKTDRGQGTFQLE